MEAIIGSQGGSVILLALQMLHTKLPRSVKPGEVIKELKTLAAIDKTLDQGAHNDEILIQRSLMLKDLHNIDSIEVEELAQKAKIRWAIEGDENSRYFHGILNSKRSQLVIRGILNDGDWIDDPLMVKKSFLDHFSNRFSKPNSSRIKLDLVFPKQLSSMQSDDLERPVTYDEVKAAVWDCGTNKSPGPDGFSFEFFCNFWSTVDKDVVDAVREFFYSDYRPISLIGSIYKIIAKILANRLRHVVDDLISEVQPAFVSQRQILDGPFILNELLSSCEHKNFKALIFKVDFEKAFDYVLRAFGFGNKWCNWIKGCLNSAKGSILVNGSPTSEFHFYKGLKQGDPLSPFLFILVMESLHLSFNRVLNAGLFKGISLNDSLTLSHLFYADDAIFVGEWDGSNIKTLVHVLKCFFLASGLKINLQKSKLMGIGINKIVVDKAARLVGCSTFSTPFNYLGVKLNTLSIGGRLTLIKYVLTSIPLYQMSIFKVSIGVLNKLESIRRNFFNGVDGSARNMSWIGWNKVLAYKKNRGLGVSSYFAFNRALLFKWVWRFFSDQKSLWAKFITAIHGEKGALDVSICSTRSVAEKKRSLSHSFRRPPRGGAEEEQFKALQSCVFDLLLPQMGDRWVWSLNSSGEFTVKSVRNYIDDILLPTVSTPTRWVKVMPIKVNIFAWRVWLDNLPTRFNLSFKGLEISSIICPCCNTAAETTSHLFFSCDLARHVWNKVLRWWNLDCSIFHSYDDWLTWLNNTRLAKSFKNHS
ncbi:RNA-directed DNA polymerase, eukaryota [Tanacetum coccineum]